MAVVYLDIETTPDLRPGALEEHLAAVEPPGNYSKPESIQKWLDENREAVGREAWLRTALDGTYGQVYCASYAIDDGEPVTVTRGDDLSDESEAALLGRLFLSLTKLSSTSGMRPVLVGHNILNFDLPFLWRRAIIRRTRPPLWIPRDPKPWGEAVIDTMTMWAGARGTIGLDRLCKALGVPGKGDMDGADVWPAIEAGRGDDVAKYCADDVRRTRAIHRRMTFA